MTISKLPVVFPVFFEEFPRRLIRVGSSTGVTVPQVFEQQAKALGERRVRVMVLRNYLIYVPLPFALEDKYQLLDLAMTALEALAMMDNDDRIKEAWKKLKELEDEYSLED